MALNVADAPPAILRADYADPVHAAAILALLDEYAAGDMGGNTPLTQQVKADLVLAMAARAQLFTLLAAAGGVFIGLANAIESFSTFAARPVLNIHDIYVVPAWRGRGVAQGLLREVERIAAERGCCKLTLEVLAINAAARSAYRRAGFAGAGCLGETLFWQKPLTP